MMTKIKPSPKPYHKMILELDGQDAELIIQSIMLNIKKTKQNNQTFRAEQLNYILRYISETKFQFHQQWHAHLLEYEPKRSGTN